MSTLPETWGSLSLEEKLGNVGSEVHRAARDREKYPESAARAFERALELIDATRGDVQSFPALKEISRARELLVDAWEGGGEYDSTLEALDTYFLHFAVSARSSRKLN
jgi:hypothetical protein